MKTKNLLSKVFDEEIFYDFKCLPKNKTPVDTPYLDTDLDEWVNLDKYVEAFDNFAQVDELYFKSSQDAVFALFKEYEETVDPSCLDFTISDSESVWKYIDIDSVNLIYNAQDNTVYVQVSTDCDWDIEHGLQIVFKEGKTLSRVSSSDGEYW